MTQRPAPAAAFAFALHHAVLANPRLKGDNPALVGDTLAVWPLVRNRAHTLRAPADLVYNTPAAAWLAEGYLCGLRPRQDPWE
jgi:hypothetical protein